MIDDALKLIQERSRQGEALGGLAAAIITSFSTAKKEADAQYRKLTLTEKKLKKARANVDSMYVDYFKLSKQTTAKAKKQLKAISSKMDIENKKVDDLEIKLKFARLEYERLKAVADLAALQTGTTFSKIGSEYDHSKDLELKLRQKDAEYARRRQAEFSHGHHNSSRRGGF